MVKLVTYFGISTILAFASIYHSYCIHEQFYPTIVYLTNNKLCILSLGNFGFCFALTIANIVIKIFFNEMADDETNEIMLRSKYSITEICIALTSFRNELNKTVIMLFVSLLFIKAFHWLTILRMENFARDIVNNQHNDDNNNNNNNNNGNRYYKYRLFSILLFLLFIDIFCSIILLYLLYQQQKFSVIVLFAFEFTILSCSIFTQICKFIVLLIDRSYDGRWSYKPTIMFIFEFFHDLIHLGLYSIFIWILTVNWGFPLHLLRELFLAFHTLRNRIIQFYNYSKIIKVLDTQFPTVTRQDLIDTQRDIICVICFSEMETGKELPCKHVFHLNCLKRWFEQKQECPMCRLKIVPNQNIIHNNNNQQQQQQNQQENNNDEQKDEQENEIDNIQQQEFDPNNFHQMHYQYHPYYQQYQHHPMTIPTTTINKEQDTNDTETKIDTDNKENKENKENDIDNNTNDNINNETLRGYPSHSSYQYPYHQYYQQYPSYQQYYNYYYPQQQQQGQIEPSAELENLTRSTQRQIEYHEMCTRQLKLSLEQYIALQSKWKQEDEENNTIEKKEK